MAWIESHTALARHPKTLRLMKALGLPRPTVIGHLHLLWWWTVEYTQDGELSRFAPDEIAMACDWEGEPSVLWSALQQAGFLDGEGTVHDWNDYAGKLLDQRRRNAERMREARKTAPAPHVQRTTKERAPHVQRTWGATKPTKPTRPTNPSPPHPPGMVPENNNPTQVEALAPDADALGAPQPAPKSRARDPIWDALAAIFGEPLSESERSKRNVACKQARDGGARLGIAPAQYAALIAEGHRRWDNVMADATETPIGLVANLSLLVHGPQRNGRHGGTVTQHRQTLSESARIEHRSTVADVMAQRQRKALPSGP